MNNNTTGNRRLLLVDDNPAIHEDYRKILAVETGCSELDDLEAAVFGEATARVESSFELVSAMQGEEALQMVQQSLAEKNPFAAAFVDMRMPPGWDGLQTIEKIWEVDPNLQVVICTAYSDYSWEEIIDRVGTGDKLLILKKPFDPIEVRQLAITLTTKWDVERVAEAAMHSIVDTAADGVVSLCDDGLVEWCNPATGELFDVDSKVVVGTDFTELIHSEDREEIRQLLAQTHSGPISARDVRGLRDGEEFPLLASLSVYSTPDGPRFTAVLRDLSEYKALQERLTRAQRLESIGQLAAGVAHEINTPLQYSAGNLEYIKDSIGRLTEVLHAFEANLDMSGESRSWEERVAEIDALRKQNKLDRCLEEVPKAIEEGIDGLLCVSNIVKAMRELAHPGSDEADYFSADLNEIVENAVRLSRNRWKRSAKLTTDLHAGMLQLECMPQDLHRVVINLITNAADAVANESDDPADPTGRISVVTTGTDDQVVLSVEDNGCGVPAEVADRIFDPFFTTKEIGLGTGQGLALSHEVVVKGHGGTIDFQPSPTGGTQFTVRLPRSQSAKSSSVASVDELVPAGQA